MKVPDCRFVECIALWGPNFDLDLVILFHINNGNDFWRRRDHSQH